MRNVSSKHLTFPYILIRCRGPENAGRCREGGIVVGKPLLMQGTPPGRSDVSGKGLQFFRKAIRVEMFRVPLHRVSKSFIYV